MAAKATETKQRIEIALFALAIFGIGCALALPDLGRHDFLAFYAAARLVATGHGREILDPAAILASERVAEPAVALILPWVHPPAVALVLAPLGLLPFGAAAVVMTGLQVASMTWAVWRLRALAAPAQRRWLFVCALVAPPAFSSLLQGQTTPFVLALVAAAIGPASFRGGLLLGLTLIRPQTALLFAVAAATSRRSALGLLAGWAAVTAASAAVVGADGLVTYARQLIDAGDWSVTGAYGLLGATGWPGLAIAVGLPRLGIALAIASLGVGALLVATSRATHRLTEASAWSILGSPHVGMADALVVYPAIAERAATSNGAAIAIVGSGWTVAVLQLAGLPIAPLWLLGLAVSRYLGGRQSRATATRGNVAH